MHCHRIGTQPGGQLFGFHQRQWHIVDQDLRPLHQTAQITDLQHQQGWPRRQDLLRLLDLLPIGRKHRFQMQQAAIDRCAIDPPVTHLRLQLAIHIQGIGNLALQYGAFFHHRTAVAAATIRLFHQLLAHTLGNNHRATDLLFAADLTGDLLFYLPGFLATVADLVLDHQQGDDQHHQQAGDSEHFQ